MSQRVSAKTDQFSSSDSNRQARPLKHAKRATLGGPLKLELGGSLPAVTVVYETYGRLNAARDNAVFICHAISGDSHVARHDENDDPGWWEVLVGPGKPVDTDRYFVICPNVLGGCRGTTGPGSINPDTGKRYGTSFPVVTVGDMVEVQRQLLDSLGVERLRAVVGGSLGGHMALTWATRFPDRVAGTVALATSARLTSQALAFDVVGRNAILQDPAYKAGRYYENAGRPAVGLAIARMLGHITYLSREAMMQKFDGDRRNAREIHTQFETKFSIGSYLAYQGDRFVERFDANSYLTLTMAIDLFDLGDTPEKLAEALARSTCRWLLVSYTSDWLFPPFQSQEIVNALTADDKPVSYCNVQSDCGHDAFLLPNQISTYGELVRSFLANLRTDDDASLSVPSHAAISNDGQGGDLPSSLSPPAPTSIFHDHRLDYETILDLIPPGASVLDLGCGTGGLLARLRDRGHQRLVGIEWDERAIVSCVDRGLDVVQADLNAGLDGFTDGQFDFVVLSQTLQTVLNVAQVLREMLRVGRCGIVSFPNVAYHKRRAELAEQGRAPRVHAEQGFQWHDTPYVRSLSIADFESFCREQGITIHDHIALDTAADVVIRENPNLNADVAVVVISRTC
ncbi:MAG: homoserine O-acetyltransferase [Planctomycetaceae bacterium]|nr:homoserine O-acetyltransferase [Planctomycetaceae bacterium]